MRKKLSNLGEKYLEEIQRVKKANIWNRNGKFTQIKLVDLQQIIATFTKRSQGTLLFHLSKLSWKEILIFQDSRALLSIQPHTQYALGIPKCCLTPSTPGCIYAYINNLQNPSI